MDPEFWQQRWEENNIGFHKDEVNLYLKSYWCDLLLDVAVRSPVLVPLCGKSNDMIWLNQQGHDVLGVEISPVAVEAFFAENNLTPEIEQAGDHEVWRSGTIEIIRGDFFTLPRETFKHILCVYDRASLVALPQNMREQYVRHLEEILLRRARILLVTLEYPQQLMDGPPFSVNHHEVERLYQDHFNIELVTQMDVLEQNTHLQDKGLDSLIEKVYKLVRK